MQFLPDHFCVPFPCGEVYVLWKALIHLEEIVVVQAGVYVDMQVRHFLEGGLPDGMPKTDAIVWEGLTYSTCDLRDGLHERGPSFLVQVPYVIDVDFGDDENMPRIRLAEVNEGKRCLVLKHNTGPSRPIDDVAEDTVVSHIPSMQT